jgi:hypothetical protein
LDSSFHQPVKQRLSVGGWRQRQLPLATNIEGNRSEGEINVVEDAIVPISFHEEDAAARDSRQPEHKELLRRVQVYDIANAEVAIAIKVTAAGLRPVGQWSCQVRG